MTATPFADEKLRATVEAALNYIKHVGANHTMRGQEHPQAWLVRDLEGAIAFLDWRRTVPEAGLTEAEKDLMLLWCEWTGGHINAQEFAVAINDRIMDNLLVKQASAPRPQSGGKPE